MAIEKTLNIFGGQATLIQGLPLATGHLTASIIGQNKTAWSQVFTYDSSSRIMETDNGKLRAAVLSHGNGVNSALSVLIFLADLIVKVVTSIASFVQGILGSFFGIGLMGIFFVLLFAFLSLMISVYVLYILAPVLLFSFVLNRIKEKRLRGVEKEISRSAFRLFEEACAPALQ